jgi:hypothetical protein
MSKENILKNITPVLKGNPLNTKKFFGSNPGIIQTNMEHFTTEPYGDSPEEMMASGEKFQIENLKTVNSQCSYARSGSPKLEGSKFLIKNNSPNIPNSMIHKKSYKQRNAVAGVYSNLIAGHASGTNFSKKTFQTHANFGRSLLANKLTTTSLPKLLSKNLFNQQQYLAGKKDSIYEGGITGVPLMPDFGRHGNSTLSNKKNVTQPGHNESNLGKTLTENYETGTDRRNFRESCQGSLKKIEQNACYEKLSQDWKSERSDKNMNSGLYSNINYLSNSSVALGKRILSKKPRGNIESKNKKPDIRGILNVSGVKELSRA